MYMYVNVCWAVQWDSKMQLNGVKWAWAYWNILVHWKQIMKHRYVFLHWEYLQCVGVCVCSRPLIAYTCILLLCVHIEISPKRQVWNIYIVHKLKAVLLIQWTEHAYKNVLFGHYKPDAFIHVCNLDFLFGMDHLVTRPETHWDTCRHVAIWDLNFLVYMYIHVPATHVNQLWQRVEIVGIHYCKPFLVHV